MAESQTLDIDALVLAAQEGDKDAFGQLYDYFFEKIYRYVYFRTPATEVEDLVEMIFIKAWVNLEKYEKRDVNFSAWLFRIAHNMVIDYRRAHRPLVKINEEMEDESARAAPKDQTEKAILSKLVRDAIEQLREPYKQVITLKFLIGLSNTEIAEILNEREGNIRVLQFRALKELKTLLQEKGIQKEFL